MNKIITFVLILFLYRTEFPTMPKKFKQNFIENMTLLNFSGNTTGTIYYNWYKKLYRIDRKNGKFDRYCGTIYKMTDTPCSHYVKDNIRYVYFPQKNYCCNCCNSENGCGILKYNWLENASKVKEYEENDETYEIWKIQGSQDNFITNIKRNKEIVKIEQVSNDKLEFESESMTMDFDDNVFDIPEICKEQNSCGYFNICWLLK